MLSDIERSHNISSKKHVGFRNRFLTLLRIAYVYYFGRKPNWSPLKRLETVERGSECRTAYQLPSEASTM